MESMSKISRDKISPALYLSPNISVSTLSAVQGEAEPVLQWVNVCSIGFLVVIVTVQAATMNAENSSVAADVTPVNRDYLVGILKTYIFLFSCVSARLKHLY